MKSKDWYKYKHEFLIPFYRDEINVIWCENCGGTWGCDFHHLTRRSRGGQNTLENIMLLCAECHHKADNATGYVEFNERLKAKANKRHWIVNLQEKPQKGLDLIVSI